MLLSRYESLYEELGGADTIRRLVDAFYPKVSRDPELAPLFPDGVDQMKEKQFLFLTQFTGGAPHYSRQYGAPKLQQRHMAFEITPKRAQAWLRCMREAMDDIGLSGAARHFLYERISQAAANMVNSKDDHA